MPERVSAFCCRMVIEQLQSTGPRIEGAIGSLIFLFRRRDQFVEPSLRQSPGERLDVSRGENDLTDYGVNPPIRLPLPPIPKRHGTRACGLLLGIVRCREVQSTRAMKEVDQNAFALHVDTIQLTRALKRLLRCETRIRLVDLRYDSEALSVSMGRTSCDVPATGTWPRPVSVARAWAKALATKPFEAAITTLRQAEGILDARGFKTRCSFDPRTEETESLVKRDEDVVGAHRILTRYKITKREVRALIGAASSATTRLWGPGDDRLIEDIAFAWRRMAIYGVEPSDIRRLIDRKSRELWKGGRKVDTEGHSLFARYNVTDAEQRALIENGDLTKAKLWGPQDGRLIDDIALAWKQLVLHGVEPSGIRLLIDRKSRQSRTSGSKPT